MKTNIFYAGLMLIALWLDNGCSTPIKQQMPEITSITSAITPYLEQQEIPGVVTVVTTPTEIVHCSAAGYRNLTTKEPAQMNTIYWIASMTKPVIAVAIMILQDQQKLDINDPVGKYIPAMSLLTTKEGQHFTITIKDLLMHTSGLAEASSQESVAVTTISDLIPLYTSKPLRYEPRSQWRYSQSGINTLGCIIEIVSNTTLTNFLQQAIFTPLKMQDTTFYPDAAQQQRLSRPYKQINGRLEEIPFWPQVDPERSHYPAPNAGLFSTALNYAHFCQMLLGNGTWQGKTVLQPESVKLLQQIHNPDLKPTFTPGLGWGLGVGVVCEPQGVTAMLSPGTYGHGGAFSTQAWIDPVQQRAYILMTQRSGIQGGDGSNLRRDFQQAAVDAFTNQPIKSTK